MTMVVDNNFKQFSNAVIIIIPFQYFNNDFTTLLEKVYMKKYSIIFITDINNIKILDKLYKNLSVPSYNYKIIIQLNNSCKQTIISNEKAKYKYIQLINMN